MNLKEENEALKTKLAELEQKLASADVNPAKRTEADIQADREARAASGAKNKVTVRFLRDFVNPRGESIIGQKGAVKTYPKTKALMRLIEGGDGDGKAILEIVKKGEAAARETATTD